MSNHTNMNAESGAGTTTNGPSNDGDRIIAAAEAAFYGFTYPGLKGSLWLTVDRIGKQPPLDPKNYPKAKLPLSQDRAQMQAHEAHVSATAPTISSRLRALCSYAAMQGAGYPCPQHIQDMVTNIAVDIGSIAFLGPLKEGPFAGSELPKKPEEIRKMLTALTDSIREAVIAERQRQQDEPSPTPHETRRLFHQKP